MNKTRANTLDTGGRYAKVLCIVASIHRQNNRPFFYCAYTDHLGARRFVSTKTADRKEAEKVARAIENTVEKARTNRITVDNARKVIEGVVQDVLASVGAKLETMSTRELFQLWLRGKNEKTRARYSTMAEAFLRFIGNKADRPITSISSADAEAFKNELVAKLAPGTAALTIKVLRNAFKKGVQLQLIDTNPMAFVETPRGDSFHKEDFTKKQIEELLAGATLEWKTMIYLGQWTGQRLQDLANLRRSNIDLQTGVITISSTRKTGRVVEIPMAPELKDHLKTLERGKGADSPLLPALAGKRSGWLSNQFYDLMAKLGYVPKRDHKKKRKGRGAKRMQNKYGFHSFRGTATSFLKNAGVSEAVAMDIIGHDSRAVSRRYTRIDLEAKRKAVTKMSRYVAGQ